MSPYADAAFLAEHSAAETPVVLMNTPVRGYGHSAFCVDNRGGARVMVSHLATVGHRRIAFISGPQDNFDATERLAGYREALHALGLEAGEAGAARGFLRRVGLPRRTEPARAAGSRVAGRGIRSE